MDKKKISFGFSKISKKPEIIPKAPKSKQVELIDCLEDYSIKIKDTVEEIKEPLIIPIKKSARNLQDRIKEAKEKRIKDEIKEEETIPDSALSVDELAARELIKEAKNRELVNETKIYTLPIKEDKFILEGEEEPTLEDYDSVPVSDYGMAMLRGMGWKEGMPIGKTHSKSVTPIIPELRPKGLGLGANKIVNKSTKVADKDGKELHIVKGGFGKITDTKHKGQYCEIQGIDIETSRCIVKTAITNEILSLHEYCIVPVNKEEYAVNSRVLNNVKYEEYKEKSKNVDVRSRSTSKARIQSNIKNRSRSCDKYKEKSSEQTSNSENDNMPDDTHKNHKKVHMSRSEKLKKNKKSKKHKYTSDSEDDRTKKNKKKHKSRYKNSESGSDQEYVRQENRKHRS